MINTQYLQRPGEYYSKMEKVLVSRGWNKAVGGMMMKIQICQLCQTEKKLIQTGSKFVMIRNNNTFTNPDPNQNKKTIIAGNKKSLIQFRNLKKNRSQPYARSGKEQKHRERNSNEHFVWNQVINKVR